MSVRLALPGAFLTATLGLAAFLLAASKPLELATSAASSAASASSCVTCHDGIEDMHPAAFLECTDCHGGDASKAAKSEAHVRPERPLPGDERVLPLDFDLAFLRFRNPTDLRVVDRTCGTCHGDLVAHLAASLHGTTAGHLSDGYYEAGASKERGGRFAVFPISSAPIEGGEVQRLVGLPSFEERGAKSSLATHYTDLPRKECVQCHLWSEGRAVRGRVGLDGDYRGAGCAACHVPYALDGLSESADAKAVRTEPGHPRRHVMTRAPSVETCTSCHYGDASIGLAFRGLSQLPPGAPGGPEIPGTTDRALNRAFYLRDDSICPPDVHYERGMHCVDCHTLGEVMGDGGLHGQMENAVEISCEACHGTFTEVSTLRTERGTPLEHLRRTGDDVILTSKVTGKEHHVPQVVHVLDPRRPEYDRNAAAAMNSRHDGVECYTCHAGWNVNFLGFHFDRNASFTQLDLLSGRDTPGRVTTQEKVFTIWKSFYAGLNEKGRVAPYMTGFSTFGSVTDEQGVRILDQVMPVTAAGLSGVTMIHHQTHTVRPTARSCVECHRAPSTWGLGSPNFRLARQFMFVADRRGIETVALDRTALGASPPLAKFVLPDVVDLALDCDPLQGHARWLYAAEGGRGVHVFDAGRPHELRRVAFLATMQPLGLYLAGDTLYVADGEGGLLIVDVSDPVHPVPRGRAATFEANDVEVQGPWAYVADGPGGLALVDVRSPDKPRVVAAAKVKLSDERLDDASVVKTMFQYSRPLVSRRGASTRRSEARMLAAVLDVQDGLVLFDVTEPSAPERLAPNERARTRARDTGSYRGLVLSSHVDLAEAQGGRRTVERDYAYVLAERGQDPNRRTRIEVWNVSDPEEMRPVAREEAAYSSEMLVGAHFYNAPFLLDAMFVAGEQGVTIADVTNSERPNQLGAIPAIRDAYAVAVEAFPLDRMVDERGRRLKDVSHEGSRWLERSEIARVLDVPGFALGLAESDPDSFGAAARRFFTRHDANGDGLLVGDEIKAAGAAVAVDADKDGRVTLREVAHATGALVAAEEGAPVRREGAPVAPSPFATERIGENGDLARLFDGLDPHEFDKDRNGALEPAELRLAAFTALDLDADKNLTRDELSRAPGETRLLRYPDPAAKALFDRIDKNGDGKVSLREYSFPDADFAVLDRDSNGSIVLPLRPGERMRSTRTEPLVPEWPKRRLFAFPLAPTDARESFFTRYDKNGDADVSRAELSVRPDLFNAIDFNGDGTLTENEYVSVFGILPRFGLDAIADGFLQRWDFDGDGKVSEAELPRGAWGARVPENR